MSVCALHPEADSTPPLMTGCVTAGTRRRNIDILCYRVNINHAEWHGVKVCVCLVESSSSLGFFDLFLLFRYMFTGLTLIRGIIFKRVINDS